MNYSVYKHTFPNGKVYIGMTGQDPQVRWNSGWGYVKQPFLFNAIQKYGWSNIAHDILFVGLTKEEAEQKEIELIAYYKSNQKEYGYNIDNGGNCVGKMSGETKKKISESLKGRRISEEAKKKLSIAHKGKKLPEEHRQKLSVSHVGHKRTKEAVEKTAAAHRGKVLSEETKRRISESNKGVQAGVKNPNYGRPRSEETKRKISESNKGKVISIEVRRKLSEVQGTCVRCAETGDIFCSIAEAERQTKIARLCIAKVCKGVQKTAGGYHWHYLYNQTLKDGTTIPGAITLGLITEEEAFKQLEEQKNTEGEN